MAKPMYKSIVWKNIYYMLCYSVKYLSDLELTDNTFENIDSPTDLFIRLLTKAHEYSLAHSSLSEYREFTGCNEHPVGIIDTFNSITSGEFFKGRLCFSYNHLDSDSIYNRIIKSAYELLRKADENNLEKMDVDTLNKFYTLYSSLYSVSELERTELLSIVNGMIDYSDLPYWHRPVIAASIAVIKNHLYNDKFSDNIVFGFDNYEQLNLIFEEFVRNFLSERFSSEYYGKILRPTYREPTGGRLMLDALAIHDNKYLVIDMKWYKNTDNAIACKYQVYRYVGATPQNIKRFKGNDSSYSLAGMLIFAETLETVDKSDSIENMVHIQVPIFVRSINLNMDFNKIKDELYRMVTDTIENRMKSENVQSDL